jgi:hypothetical protein
MKTRIDLLPAGAHVTVLDIVDSFAIVEYTEDGETLTGAVAVNVLSGELEYDVFARTRKNSVYLYTMNSRGRMSRTRLRYPAAGAKLRVIGLSNGYWQIAVLDGTYYIKTAEAALSLR